MDAISIRLCGYSYHTSPFRMHFKQGLDTYIIRLQTEGSSTALIDGKYADVQAGELMLFRPGDIYDLQIGMHDHNDGLPSLPSGDYYLFCTGTWIDEWYHQTKQRQKYDVSTDDRLIGLWKQLILEKRRSDGGNAELTELLCQSLCLYISRLLRESSTESPKPSYLVMRMKNYIEEHAAEPVQLKDIAHFCGLSVSRSVHLFKESFGISMNRYMQQVRLELAIERMQYSTLSLEQIAEMTGFGSYTHLHRLFKLAYGSAPGEYRKRKGWP